MNEILLIDKPKGMTSFDVIRELRKKLEIKKMGHAGTLDPLASGLLLIATGKNTKKLNNFLKLPKTYEVEVLVGESRTTGDMEGEIIDEKKVKDLDENNVKDVLNSLVGEIDLPVPKFSAIKVEGEALYKKARRGEDFKPPVKKMVITDVDLKSAEKINDKYILDISIDVGSGAYIRSIAEEIGRRLGYPAVVKELRRTVIGEFKIEDSKKLEDI